jgi:oxygen-independent coproporphyrinogen-3 oxidase
MTTHDQPIALYVHVPFCQARCTYCDFNTFSGLQDLIPAYTSALRQEIRLTGKLWGSPRVATVFFGGGTPSLLQIDQIADILDGVSSTFRLTPGAEITLEANPGTLSLDRLRGLRKLGINRLSLGVQSARDEELKLLGRIHTWPDATRAVEWARIAGFDNLSLDLIFGLPGQSLGQWRKTVDDALRLQPEHLSLYALTLEPGRPLERAVRAGQLPQPDDDAAADMYEQAESCLARASYFHYEISNWAICPALTDCHETASPWWLACAPGNRVTVESRSIPTASRSENISPYVCRHNLAYWRNQAWLGLGAGAHSWFNKRRWANLQHPRDYIAALEENRRPTGEVESIDRRLEIGETMMMGLRLAEGIDDERFHSRFDIHLEDIFREELETLRRQGLLSWDGNTVRLTARGRLLANQVFASFL